MGEEDAVLVQVKTSILVFARTPAAGRVKTRLLQRITAEQALRLHEVSNAMPGQQSCLAAVLGSKFRERVLAANGQPCRPQLRPSGMLCRSWGRCARFSGQIHLLTENHL